MEAGGVGDDVGEMLQRRVEGPVILVEGVAARAEQDRDAGGIGPEGEVGILGAVAVPELVRQAPNAKLIVQITDADESNTVELYRRGVRGVIPRSISPDLLVKCVRKIADGETWIDNQSISWVIEAYRAQASALTNPKVQPKLSKKELAIISCITRGMRNKEIAYQIGTTEQVIKNYLRKVYDKLGVSDRLELALYCLHHELLKQYGSTGTGYTGQEVETLQVVSAKA